MPIARDSMAFYEMVKLGESFGRIPRYKILIEGDSWVAHPFLTDLTTQLDMLGDDEFAILHLADPGHTAQEMFRKHGRKPTGQLKRLDQVMHSARYGEHWDMIFISAGGNDIVGEEVTDFVDDFDPNGPRGEALLNARFDAELEKVIAAYDNLLDVRRRSTINKETPIVTHVYGFVEPRQVGTKVFGASFGDGWIKQYLDPKGIPQEDQRDIVKGMLTRFRDALRKVEAANENFLVVDTLRTLAPRGIPNLEYWHDEIHPTGQGFRKVALKIRREARAAGFWPGG
jgi:hypothetical protein